MVLDNVADAFLTEQLLAVSQALKEIETLESTFNSFCDTAQNASGLGFTPRDAQVAFEEVLQQFESVEETIHRFGLSSLTHPVQTPSRDSTGNSNELLILFSTLETRIGLARNLTTKLNELHKKRLQGSRAALDGFSRTFPTQSTPDSSDTLQEKLASAVLLTTVDTQLQQDNENSLSA